MIRSQWSLSIFTRCLVVTCLVLLTAYCLLPTAFGQGSTATLSGTVEDQNGATVPGATITVLNNATASERQTTTNEQGYFTLPLLQPGSYTLTARRDGFAPVQFKNVVLNVGDQKALRIQLKAGDINAVVQVIDEVPLVNTESPAVSTVVDRQFVENMPLNGRSFQSLLTMAPGVAAVPNTGSQVAPTALVGYGGEIAVNGQRTEANYFTVDGVSSNTGTAPGFFTGGAGFAGAVPGETALGTTQSLVSIDALQEFRASTSTNSAEYGRLPGGQFSFVTRSGTNEWHGSAYDYFRNDALDANNWFNNAASIPKQAERQNDFGGTLGGPIIIPGLYNGRNKTFFFFSYEGLRLRQPQAAEKIFVPDASLHQNAPPALQPILNAFPIPDAGDDGLNDGLAFHNQAVSNPSSLNNVGLRLDHSFNDRFKIFGRYANTPSSSSSYSWAIKQSRRITVRTLTLGATNILTSRQGNELRFNITQNDNENVFESTNVGGATPFDITSIPGPKGAGFPRQASLLLVCICYGGFPEFFVGQQATAQRQYNLTETYSWNFGRHGLKFGVDWRRLSSKAAPQTIQEFMGYSSKASVLANSVDFGNAFSQAPSTVEPVYTNFSAFAQDQWKATHRLSVSLGLRWDVIPPPGNALGQSPYTLTQITDLTTTKLAPAGTPLWKTTWNNFAPRLGVAYQLHQSPGRETVVRGGFGMFYDMGNTNGSQGFSGPGFSSIVQYSGISFPLTSAQLQVPTPTAMPPYGFVYAFDPNLKLPYTLQWNVAIQQALGGKQTLTLSYVGSSGRRLLTQFFYFPGQLGNPNFALFGGLQLTTNQGASSYNGLQVQYQRRLSHGVQALASYTWSHSIDNASSNFSLRELLRASSDFDIRHNFQAAVTYNVPGRYSNPVVAAILSHWGLDTRISARSGLPIEILATTAINPITRQVVNLHPDLVAGQPIYLYGSQYPGGRAINYNAFTRALGGRDGNVPRNFARGFDAVQADLALRRDFPIHERLRLQFRAEAFNVFNHPNFGSIYNFLFYGPTLFGQASTTLNTSLGGLSPLYQIGGPRSLQLMLRLNF